jgi:dihydrofolate reductase
MVSIIAAVSSNGYIGYNNKLPWPKIPEDMEWFRKHTMGHTVIMGRKTWESIGSKPLPGRKNIILSRDISLFHPEAIVLSSLEFAVNFYDGDSFIIGGGQLFEKAYPMVDRIYLTRVCKQIKGDTKFYFHDHNDFTCISHNAVTSTTGIELYFNIYERRYK